MTLSGPKRSENSSFASEMFRSETSYLGGAVLDSGMVECVFIARDGFKQLNATEDNAANRFSISKRRY